MEKCVRNQNCNSIGYCEVTYHHMNLTFNEVKQITEKVLKKRQKVKNTQNKIIELKSQTQTHALIEKTLILTLYATINKHL